MRTNRVLFVLNHLKNRRHPQNFASKTCARGGLFFCLMRYGETARGLFFRCLVKSCSVDADSHYNRPAIRRLIRRTSRHASLCDPTSIIFALAFGLLFCWRLTSFCWCVDRKKSPVFYRSGFGVCCVIERCIRVCRALL